MKTIKTLTVAGETYSLGHCDDTKVADGAWSAKKLVDTLCPAFSATGTAVSCNPVEGYPLRVVSNIQPRQAGSGDPSPENIRPIKGLSELTLRQCGKNLLSADWKNFQNYDSEKNFVFRLPAGKYVLSAEKTNITYLYLQKSTDGGNTWSVCHYLHTNGTQPVASFAFEATGTELWALWTASQGYLDYLKWVQIEAGTVATAFEPYDGQTLTAPLESPLYGGVYNWQTGALTVTHDCYTLTGQESYRIEDGAFVAEILLPFGGEARCSHGLCNDGQPGCWYERNSALCYTPNGDYSLDESGLAAFRADVTAWYAQGTPVQFGYQLAVPTMVQRSSRDITAKAGVNQFFAEEELTVEGRWDLKKLLEGAVQ